MNIKLLFLSLLVHVTLFSQGNTNVQQSIESFARESGLANASISFQAYNITKDSVLASYHAKQSLPNASTTKLFTTAAAYEILGKNYRPKTAVYIDGEIDENGMLDGNIIVRGLGDPTLGSSYFYGEDDKKLFLEEWTEKIKSAGIKLIRGQIIADGSAFGYNGVPDGWNWSDIGNYYGAGSSGIALYDNMTHLHFSTSSIVGKISSLDSMTPSITGYELENRVISENIQRDNAYIYGAPFSNHHFATGSLPKGRSNFEVKASIPDPEVLMAEEFHRIVENNDISISLPPIGYRTLQREKELKYNDYTLLFTSEGKTIDEIVHWTNYRSVNFFAEQLLSLIGWEQVQNGSTDKSVKYLNGFWKNRLGISMYQTDGSGLSRSNGFSAEHFVKLLTYMSSSKNSEVFENSLPVAGESGTMRGVCRGQAAAGKMKAKSGTMNRIKSYAGYIETRGGDKVAFSITVNNYDLTSFQVMKKMERIFNAIALLP